MAKMKVHELAKELNIKSKDIIGFLQEKGVDVKVAQSTVEPDAVEWVKKKFGTAPAAPAAPEGAQKVQQPQKPAAEAAEKQTAQTHHTMEKTVQAERKAQVEKAETTEKKTAQAAEQAKDGQGKPHKKAKTIIVVNNPQNSRMKNGGSGNGERRNGGNGGGRGNDRRNEQGRSGGDRDRKNNRGKGGMRVESRPLIKPLTKPSQPVMPDEKLLSMERAAKEAAAKKAAEEAAKAAEIEAQKKAEAAARERAEKADRTTREQRETDGRQDRPQRSDRDGRSDRDNRGDRPQGANRGDRGSYQGRDNRGGDRNNDRNGANRGDRSGYQGNRDNRDNRGGDRNGVRRDGQGFGGRRDQGRPGANGPARDGQGYNRNAAGGRPGAGNTRPGANNGRPSGSDGRQDNRFRKPAPGKGFTPEPPAKDTEKRRDERRASQQERDKKSRRDATMYEDDAAKLKNSKKAGRFIKPEPKPAEPEEVIKVITVPESITIKELAEKMKIQPAAIIKKLFLQGKIVTLNQELSYEDAENIAIEYDIICEKEVKVDVIEELLKEDDEKPEDLVSRPPVICVMGHVDHGKTSLLDAIRKTNVTDREAGGITQHIGAYTVQVNGQKITFLDTPGHEAFTAMRMRGANATDIAVLVVAADDGVMPQTVEAINHAKAAGIEIIVAVNKIDKPNANVDRVKQELTEYELVAEDWGGSTVFVPVSAKTGEGLQQLLEMILLTSEVMELKANPNRQARGIVLEAQLDKGRGPVASVLVQKGTLHVGDFVSAGSSSGKVRAMIDDKGRRVKEAGPSTPVEILGLSDVPEAGDVFLAHESDKEAKSYAAAFIEQNKEKKLEETKSRMSLDDLFNQIKEGNLKELNLIVKADVQGSVEAVKQSLTKLSNEEIVVKCIHGGVGAINESDVTLASASNAIIIGFNVRPDATAKATAELEGVDIRLYKVIYQAIEDVEAAMKGMLDPVYEEKVIGHAEVRQIFRASAIGNIAGSYVLDGVFTRGCKVRITREGEQIYEGSLASLKRFKDDVKEVKAGFECGLVFEGFDKMQELDIVEAYTMVEVPR
ncbi:MAG: translation initiation factor IF-2 [Eubacteriales bacterium]|nr:translation initiation factor IF-2 [Eubacteriales bacterium]